jgi:hypothetical protein
MPTDRLEDNVTFTRAVAYLPAELFGRRVIFSEGPSTSLARRLEPESVGNGDLVLGIRKSALCTCARLVSFLHH